MSWERLAAIDANALRAARGQAHQAVQIIAASGETWLTHEPDTSHTAMRWDTALGSFVGRALPGEGRLRVAVRLADLTLCLLDRDSRALARSELAGRTLADAHAWLTQRLEAETRGGLRGPLVHPGFELPAHPVASGGRFERAPGLAELARWYANAQFALERATRGLRGAGALWCWPHHFDLASLVELARAPDGPASRTLGAGLSPGDAAIDEPYAYVNHWPATARHALPALAAGEWITQGWVGAALRGSALVAAGDAADQESLLRAFLASAIDANRALALEGPPGR